MPSPFVDVLRRPGAWQFSLAGLIARLPLSMISIGLVLLVEAERGSYTLAGAVTATTAVAEAFGQPVVARRVDRYGQRRVITPVLAAHAVLVPLVVGIAVSELPAVWLFPVAAAAGATFPPVGSLVRARWNALLGEGPLLRTAFSLESVADELVFVIGPPLITAVALLLGAPAAVLGTLLFLVPGTATLLLQRRTEPALQPQHDNATGILRNPGLPAVIAVMFFLGGLFGAVEVATIATADVAGRPGAAGIVLAAYALGSLIAGVAYGQLHLTTPISRQFTVAILTAAITSLLLLPASASLTWLAVATFVAGASISPSLITGFGLAVAVVPGNAVTQGLTWASSGLVLGFATASAVTGAVVDLQGTRAAFTVAVISALAAALTAARSRRRMSAATTA
jgi:MFS family permease